MGMSCSRDLLVVKVYIFTGCVGSGGIGLVIKWGRVTRVSGTVLCVVVVKLVTVAGNGWWWWEIIGGRVHSSGA